MLSTSDYPKLDAIQRRASKNPASTDLSTLVRLPETEAESKEAEQTVTRFNSNNLTQSSTAKHQEIGEINTASNLDNPEPSTELSKPELDRVEKLQKSLGILCNTLASNISNTNC